MSLPHVRRTDCGHAVAPVGAPSNALWHDPIRGEVEVRLCAACLAGLSPVVTKDVQPASATEWPAADPPAVADAENGALETIRAAGRDAALRGEPEEACPYSDRRTREAKAWRAGYGEAGG